VSELTALRKEDFRLDGDGLVVRIFGTKTGEYRDVPVHPQLIEIGLRELLQEAAPGPLFYAAKGATSRAAQSVSEKLAKWIRDLGTDERVQPNHGWRHRFTSVARAVGMDREKREYILGHTLPGLGGTYGDMRGLVAEIVKLPRYELTESLIKPLG
jgi:integrase